METVGGTFLRKYGAEYTALLGGRIQMKRELKLNFKNIVAKLVGSK